MMRGKPTPATPDQIARFGHIAAALRAYVQRTGMSVPEFNQVCGYAREYSGPYVWMAAKGGPGPTAREALSKVMGIPANDLRAKSLHMLPPPSRAVAPYKPPNVMIAPARAPGGDVLTFAVDRQGMARLKLDAVLPLDKATPLLRMLLDAGLIYGEADDAV